MRFFGNIACVLLSGWFLAGCVTEPPPAEKKVTDARVELINNDEFSMELLSSTTKIDDSGFLTVDVAVALSRTPVWAWIWGGDPKLEVGYRFQWISARGAVQESVKHVISSLPGNIVSIHGVAPSEQAVSFKLKIFLNGQEKTLEAVKAEAKAEAKPTPKAEAAKPAVKAEAKTEAAKPAVKAEAKTEAAKPAPKAEPAPPPVKAEAKTEVKPAPKADSKGEPAKPAPKPAKLTEPFE